MERILLVPLDGSIEAEAALPHAVRVARAAGWSIRLARVIAHPSAYLGLAGPYAMAIDPQPLWEQAQATARAYLEHTAAQVQAQGVTVSRLLLEGDPATALLGYVGEEPAVAMVAMATHGRSGVRHLLFGSVAEKILHATPVPLLLARSQTPEPLADCAPYRTVLVPLDGSVQAEHALLLAHMLARKAGGELLLMHALPSPADVALAAGAGIEWDYDHLTQRYARAEAYLHAKAQPYAAAGTPARALVRDGQPGEQIVAAAAEAGAELIVMATHGYTGLRRLWLGSVAIHVVRHSAIPVLLVREEEERAPAQAAVVAAPEGLPAGAAPANVL
ncbi:MAG TPA: universal stress protein [Herpetosiphonaceae bacterium]